MQFYLLLVLFGFAYLNASKILPNYAETVT